MALTTLHLVGIPLLAGVVAGTGVLTTSGARTEQAAPAAVAAVAPRSCETQTWPYLDKNCVSNSAPQDRKVRLVMAPRANEDRATNDAPAISTAKPAKAPAEAAPNTFVTRDTVLRAPEYQSPPSLAVPAAAPAPTVKRKEAQRKQQRRYTAQSYQVPSGPVIVVRPLRYD